jgi:DNA-binding Lrp family transcriptional regulator
LASDISNPQQYGIELRMDETDRKILRILQEDSTIQNRIWRQKLACQPRPVCGG